MGRTSFSGLRSKGDTGEPGYLVLKSSAGVEHFLWVDDAAGDLRINTNKPTSDTDGTIVGTQS